MAVNAMIGRCNRGMAVGYGETADSEAFDQAKADVWTDEQICFRQRVCPRLVHLSYLTFRHRHGESPKERSSCAGIRYNHSPASRRGIVAVQTANTTVNDTPGR